MWATGTTYDFPSSSQRATLNVSRADAKRGGGWWWGNGEKRFQTVYIICVMTSWEEKFRSRTNRKDKQRCHGTSLRICWKSVGKKRSVRDLKQKSSWFIRENSLFMWDNEKKKHYWRSFHQEVSWKRLLDGGADWEAAVRRDCSMFFGNRSCTVGQ